MKMYKQGKLSPGDREYLTLSFWKELSIVNTVPVQIDEEEKVAREMEDNFATNIAEKLGLPDSVTSKLKGEMMQNMISGVQKKLSSEGVNSLDGIMDKFGDNELVDKYKKKLGIWNN